MKHSTIIINLDSKLTKWSSHENIHLISLAAVNAYLINSMKLWDAFNLKENI